jgi:carbon storage regulator
MLVFTRRTGEEIVIDGNIRVSVTAVRGDRVRIGITAPEFVRVDRGEVHERRSARAEADRGIRSDPNIADSGIHRGFIAASGDSA